MQSLLTPPLPAQLPWIWTMLSLGALLVHMFPSFFGPIASHGKLRRKSHGHNHHPVTAATSFAFMHHPLLQVPKRWFIHFYVIGSSLTSLHMFTIHRRRYHMHMHMPAHDNYSLELLPVSILLCLFLLHCIRRWLECIWFLSEFKQSKMHLLGYLVGVLHYIVAPYSLATATFNPILTPSQMIAIIVFIFANVEQLRIHRVFYYVKKEKMKTGNAQTQRSLPSHLAHYLFAYICCPHYLMEIIIYVSFVLYTSGRSLGLVGMLLWVTTNLAVVADVQYKWYYQGDKYEERSRHRSRSTDIAEDTSRMKRLIPFVW